MDPPYYPYRSHEGEPQKESTRPIQSWYPAYNQQDSEHDEFQKFDYDPADWELDKSVFSSDSGFSRPVSGSSRIGKRNTRRLYRNAPSRPIIIPAMDLTSYGPLTNTPPGSAEAPRRPTMPSFPSDVLPPIPSKSAPPAPVGQQKSVSPRPKFTVEEDAKILKLRGEHKLPWQTISTLIPNRSEKGLQVHYSVSLKDQMQDCMKEWTTEEDEQLLGLVREHERAMWQVISKRVMHQVCPAACYSRYRTLVRREEDLLEKKLEQILMTVDKKDMERES